MKIVLERLGKEKLEFTDVLNNSNSSEFTKLTNAVHDGLDRMVMQSDLRDIYHGIKVKGYQSADNNQGLMNEFYLQVYIDFNVIQILITSYHSYVTLFLLSSNFPVFLLD